jgi:acyl dehydratase
MMIVMNNHTRACGTRLDHVLELETAVSDSPSTSGAGLYVGQRFVSGQYTLDAEEIKQFARQYDPQPFHLDEDSARDTFFNGLAASGWQTAAITMRLLVDTGLALPEGIIGAGGEITWPQPTRPGDTLQVFSEVISIAPSRSRPGKGIALVRCETMNQRKETVQVLVAKLMATLAPAAI